MAKFDSFDSFKEAYLGKAVDYDDVAGIQCVDLVDRYLEDIFGITGVWVDGARDLFNKFTSFPPLVVNFTKIPNKEELVVQKGDIVVWGGGTWGHCGIGTGVGNLDYFETIEENTLGKHEPTQVVKHYFEGNRENDGCNPVLGVLRPKHQDKVLGQKKEEEKPSTPKVEVKVEEPKVEKKPEIKITYKTLYVNYEDGLNYRSTPNGELKGTFANGTAVEIIEGSETTVNGLVWVKIKNGNFVAKKYLSETKPVIKPTVEKKVEAPKTTVAAASYEVGKTYTLQYDMKVRVGAGTSYLQKKRSQLTPDGKKNSYAQTYAVLKKGTKVTILKVVKYSSNEIWGLIPSGYICLKYGKTTYVK